MSNSTQNSANSPSTAITDAWLPAGTPTSLTSAPTWFTQKQTQALNDYKLLGLPNVRDEEWRYTKLRAISQHDFRFADNVGTVSALEPSNNVRLVFVDGHFSGSLSNTKNLPTGVVFCDLASALSNHADELEKLFGSTLPENQHGFGLLNSAFANTGYALIASKDCVLKAPLEAIFLHSTGTASHTRNLVLAKTNSSVQIIERHFNENSCAYLNNTITEMVAENGAKIDHYKVQQESENAFHIGAVYSHQKRDSIIKSHNFCLDGKLIRNDIHAHLLGEGAHNEMNGLVLGGAEQHIDNCTEMNHAVPHCTSDEFYKTVLDDRSRSVFRGRIIVAQDAQLTNADQQNNNLLLSPRAEADTKPQLEIYADDVKCSHGATVGQLDTKSLFYLQSRGISLEDACALLTFAFANEVVERINIDSIKDEISGLIAGELVSNLKDVL